MNHGTIPNRLIGDADKKEIHHAAFRVPRLPGFSLVALLLGAALPCAASAAELTVENPARLAAALKEAAPGDVITVKCDLEGFSIKGCHGTAEAPITIRSDEGLKRTVRGTITIQDSRHVRLEGFAIAGFSSNAVKVVASSDLRITRNFFDFTGITAANGIYTSCEGGPVENIEISYNEFNHHTAPGDWSGSYIKTWFNGNDVARKLWIHHNLFANIAPKIDRPGTANPFDGDSDREALIFGEGDSQTLETEHLIEHNFFEDCDGEDEMISFKTSRNTFRYNTVKNCMGSVHIRFGHSSLVHGNLFIGDPVTDFSDAAYTAHANHESSGVVVYGTDHKVYNNQFQNLTGGRTSRHRLPVVIGAGDTDATTGNDHQRSRRVLVCHNTFSNCQYGIGIGLNYELPPLDCVVANNLFAGIGVMVFRMSPDSESDKSCQYENNLASVAGAGVYGMEEPIIKLDPLLVPKEFNGFLLHVPESGSPVTEASTGGYVNDDFFGAGREGIPDIGAVEQGSPILRVPLSRENVGPRSGPGLSE